MVERTAHIEPYASGDARLLDGVRGDERRAGEHRASIEHLHLTQALPFPNGEFDLDRHDDALEERPFDVDHP